MNQTRKDPRYPLAAPAEVVDQASGAKISGRVKELSLFGCYLDTQSPLPMRTKVTVRIHAAAEFFEASATVIYASQTLGMGVVFRDVKPLYLGILRKWLVAAMQEVQRQEAEERALNETHESKPPDDEPPANQPPVEHLRGTAQPSDGWSFRLR